MRPTLAGKVFGTLAALGLLALPGCMTPNPLALGKGNPPAPFVSPKLATTQFRALAVPANLIRIGTASSPEFDRVVFTFSGKTVPGYWFSSQGTAPGGPVLFEMRFGARANKANGKPAFDRAWQDKTLDYPVLRRLAQWRVGEESSVWQASLAKESDYRVLELSNPPRIIVDFKR